MSVNAPVLVDIFPATLSDAAAKRGAVLVGALLTRAVSGSSGTCTRVLGIEEAHKYSECWPLGWVHVPALSLRNRVAYKEIHQKSVPIR